MGTRGQRHRWQAAAGARGDTAGPPPAWRLLCKLLLLRGSVIALCAVVRGPEGMGVPGAPQGAPHTPCPWVLQQHQRSPARVGGGGICPRVLGVKGPPWLLPLPCLAAGRPRGAGDRVAARRGDRDPMEDPGEVAQRCVSVVLPPSSLLAMQEPPGQPRSCAAAFLIPG